MQEELFAKCSKLLKRVTLRDLKQIDDRWYPMRMTYKDTLKTGEGTEFIVDIHRVQRAHPRAHLLQGRPSSMTRS